jgi:hypothetical protein
MFVIRARPPKSGRFRRWLATWFGCLKCFDGKRHDEVDCHYVPADIRLSALRARRERREREELARQIAKAVAEELNR